jgi:hypothetical protein
MNNRAIQIREFLTQDEIESLKSEPRDEQSIYSKKKHSKLKDEIESLKPEPRDEYPTIQRSEFQTQR